MARQVCRGRSGRSRPVKQAELLVIKVSLIRGRTRPSSCSGGEGKADVGGRQTVPWRGVAGAGDGSRGVELVVFRAARRPPPPVPAAARRRARAGRRRHRVRGEGALPTHASDKSATASRSRLPVRASRGRGAEVSSRTEGRGRCGPSRGPSHAGRVAEPGAAASMRPRAMPLRREGGRR